MITALAVVKKLSQLGEELSCVVRINSSLEHCAAGLSESVAMGKNSIPHHG